MAKYRLELVKRRKWGGYYKFPNCATTLCPAISRTGNYTTGLSDADVDRLAKATGMKREALLPPSGTNDSVGSYWRNFAVRVTTKGIDIDTDEPFGEILYLFCKASGYVADGSENVSSEHDCVLLNVDKEAIIKNKKNRKRRAALKVMADMSITEMRNALTVLGIQHKGYSDEAAEARLQEEVENNPDRFNTLWVDNPDLKTALMIEQAIEANVLRRTGAGIFFGTHTLGRTTQEAVAWCRDDKNAVPAKAMRDELAKKEEILGVTTFNKI